MRVGTQHCWDNLISDQRRKGMELGEENEKVVTQQRHQQSGAAGSDRRTEFKLRKKDYVWLKQSGASGPGCAGLGHGSGVVVDLTPTELDVVPSSLLHHSTSCEAPPQSPPPVENAEGEERDVADEIGVTESSCLVVSDPDNSGRMSGARCSTLRMPSVVTCLDARRC